jgi:DNA mismatch repair protein MutL
MAVARRVSDLLSVTDDNALIAVGESTSYLTLRGYVGRPDLARKGRNDGFIFVNGRPIKHRSLDHAVLQSYGALLPEGRRPFFALFLEVDPRHVDVNVHPAKTEVKFDDEGGVYAFVRAVVKRGLGAANLTLLWADAAGAASGAPGGLVDFEARGARERWSGLSSEPLGRTDAHGYVAGQAGDGGWVGPMPGPIPSRIASDPEPPADTSEEASGGAILAIHGRYLLTAIRSGLIVVDQQAAHVRILYERALAALEGGLAASQQLLFPHAVELDPADRELLKELASDLRALGFALEVGAGRAVILRGVPSDVRMGSEARVLQDVLAAYRDAGGLFQGDRNANLARALARRSAVAPGHVLKLAEARTLIDQLFACKEPYVDPDGRPTMTRLSLEDIERRFSRPAADVPASGSPQGEGAGG